MADARADVRIVAGPVKHEYVCDGFIEVTLTGPTSGTFGELPVLLEGGTKVDAPCGTTIATDDERVESHAVVGGVDVHWDCPLCGKTNWRRADA